MGGYGVLGLRQINTCRKVTLQVNFFKMTTFALQFCLSTYPPYNSTVYADAELAPGAPG
jgi:hypothetical protein